MSETLERIQKRARELARSGKFAGWRAVTFELQFEPGLEEAFQWLHSASVEDAFQWLHSPVAKEELARLCYEAKQRLPATIPKPGIRNETVSAHDDP